MIDWKRIRELHDEIGGEEFREVFDLFLLEVGEVVGRLRTAPDPARLEADLHFVKGCALNLGFDELGRLCSEGERRAADGTLGPDELRRVVETFEVSRARFLENAEQALGA